MAQPIYYNRVKETTTSTGTGNLTLSGAATGYQSFSVAGTTNTFFYVIENPGTSEWEIGIGNYFSGTLIRNSVINSSTGSAVNFSAGTKTVFLSPPATQISLPDPGVCEGRLTLTSGSPLTFGNITGATTIYFSPYKGSRISLYSSSLGLWQTWEFTELSVSLSGLTTTVCYDVFVYNNSGTLTLQLVAWSSATARSTALTLVDGVYLKTGDTDKRYLGTFFPTAATTTEDSASKRYLWNYYNRAKRHLVVNLDNHTYNGAGSAAFRAWNNSTTYRVEYCVGVAEVMAEWYITHYATTAATTGYDMGFGIDSTTANSGTRSRNVANTSVYDWGEAYMLHYPAIGKHYIQALESAVNSVNFGAEGNPMLLGYMDS